MLYRSLSDRVVSRWLSNDFVCSKVTAALDIVLSARFFRYSSPYDALAHYSAPDGLCYSKEDWHSSDCRTVSSTALQLSTADGPTQSARTGCPASSWFERHSLQTLKFRGAHCGTLRTLSILGFYQAFSIRLGTRIELGYRDLQ